MSLHSALRCENAFAPNRRKILGWSTMLAAATGMGITGARAQQGANAAQSGESARARDTGTLRKGLIGFMLAHEQFPVPELVQLGALASRSGFHLLATSDHLQPWQANQGHCGQAWVTLGALGGQGTSSWMGTTVTCPTLRYDPAIVAEAFASLSLISPGRIFLGVGSGEALNEEAGTGAWPKWQERWDRLIEAITIIRQLWTGQEVSHKGTYYTVDAKLYDPPARPIPLLTAANGRKSMRLAGQHGDGLITDPHSWKQYKSEWEDGARSAGKNPADMPVLVEQYVVVGDQEVARQAAELWRFGPKAWHPYFNIPSPVKIQHLAESQIPIEEVIKEWAIGTDPEVHIKKLQELFASGATIVNVHSGQPDQQRVIQFYASNVLPKFAQGAGD
ncbi:MAG TPA: TIGR03557 family F420-dependent LLM class oxidoreductase [Acetobacteraceae bacterium]|nr:TIGR03557 family F420-dependent LLM class oxidoreductase [Acetobacteraceae bacterium]